MRDVAGLSGPGLFFKMWAKHAKQSEALFDAGDLFVSYFPLSCTPQIAKKEKKTNLEFSAE